MKKLLGILVLTLFIYGNSNAQFTPEHHYLGPCIGLSFLGTTPQFGVNYEYGMDIQNFGRVGIGGIFRYWGYSSDNWNYSDVLIGAQGNYHFKLETDKFDPWLGLTLAYNSASVSWDGPVDIPHFEPSVGGFFLGIDAGARYWVSPTIAISGRLGFGSLSYGGLDVGVDFKF